MKKVMFRSEKFRIEKEGQYYKVYQARKRTVIASFLLYDQAANHVSELTNKE